MKNFIVILAFFGILSPHLVSQDVVFSMEISSDTILLGNYLELTYKIENAQGEFEAPDFGGIRLISGPNFSSSISIINGAMKSAQSYTYILSPPDVGVYTIGPAFLTVEDQTLEAKPISILVMPNPDGIELNPEKKIFRDSLGQNKMIKPKKKRKLKKI